MRHRKPCAIWPKRSLPVTDTLLTVTDLRKYFDTEDDLFDRIFGNSQSVKAVDGISFEIQPGTTLGLVGESGCGKSTAAETILGLQEPTAGTVRYEGKPLLEMSGKEWDEFRQDAQIVFQDPAGSLNPRSTVEKIITEPLRIHNIGTPQERTSRAAELLEQVGLSRESLDRYPHEFSGGQKRRIGIARALAIEPDFLVLDEPVASLDVSVQAQILNLLVELQNEMGLTYLIISHDLSVIKYVSDFVVIMYLGRIAEKGPTNQIFSDPQHPYTKALLQSIPSIGAQQDTDWKEGLLTEDPPSPRDPPSGCRFHTRCSHAREYCQSNTPTLESRTSSQQHAACFRTDSDSPYWESTEL